MILESPYPSIPEPSSFQNYYSWILERPEVGQWPNYLAYIEGGTGKSYRLRHFIQRVEDLAGALAGPEARGGINLQMDTSEMVGILSENNIVCGFRLFAALGLMTP